MKEKITDTSKEDIKVRMLQNAVKIWGVKNTAALDPLIRLLIDAFSAELLRVNNQVQTIENRILEKLAKLLTPTIYTYPRPAHAIATIFPTESTEILPKDAEFNVQKRFLSSTKNDSGIQVDISFTPLGAIRLVNMKVSTLFIGNSCYKIDQDFSKIPIARIPKTHSLPYNKIIMGIDVSEYKNEKLPDTLSFYCSNPAFEHLDFLYKLLSYIKVTQAGNPLKVTPNLTYIDNDFASGYAEVFKGYSIQNKIEEDINYIYKDYFIEISGKFKIDSENNILKQLPLEFSQDEKVLNHILDNPHIWLEIEFPAQYKSEILENFSFVLNAFPVYNRNRCSNENSLNIVNNTVPLATNPYEHFLYVEKVIDGYGNIYEDIPFSQTQDSQKGLYTVRCGGMERFDERNAVDIIDYLIDLLRDEVSAFKNLERDALVKSLPIITEQIKILQQKVKTANQNSFQDHYYIIAELNSKTENLRTDYWITHCELANHLRPLTKLKPAAKSELGFYKNLTLLTESSGGGKEQKGSHALEAYKYALSTRDKIITIEDVKSFCRYFIKTGIKRIHVKRRTAISDKPQEGFIRVIETEIIPQDYKVYEESFWANYAREIKKQIEIRAIDGLEYRVKIINEDDE